MSQEERLKTDRELLISWEKEYRAGFSWAGDKYSRAFEVLVPMVKSLLEAQKRITQTEERARYNKELEIADNRWKEAERKLSELLDNN